MVGMGMSIEDRIDTAEPVAQGLFTKIGPGIDETTARSGRPKQLGPGLAFLSGANAGDPRSRPDSTAAVPTV